MVPIPSLAKLCSVAYCQQINNQSLAPPLSTAILSQLKANSFLLDYVMPYLHWRWLQALVEDDPELSEKASPYIAQAMQREEDHQRRQDKNEIELPLLDVFALEDTFKKVKGNRNGY